ncbi:MAG TPA: YncE family protein [Mycobacteriales bacterium]|nr:YncE family protein [Mycobacteriales bacterium]
MGRHRASRGQRLSITVASVVTLVVTFAHGGLADPDHMHADAAATRPASPAHRAVPSTPLAGMSASSPLPGTPPIASSSNIYADAGANKLSAAVAGDPYRIYVPNSGGSSVDVIDPKTMQIVNHFSTGLNPQHVVPSWDMKTLYVTNDLANTLTPIDPKTASPAGPNIPVDDPYNMYFTPNGKYAIVVAEARRHLDFRDPRTFALRHRLSVPCPGIDHMDFSANGGYLIASCEFSGQIVKINLHTLTVMGYLHLPGSSPQDVKLDPTGHVFFVADRYRGGVWRIDGAHLKTLGFIKTGADAHGLYPSRDGKLLYVTNRRAGSVTVLDFATGRTVTTWRIPGGATPDMGNVSPDGTVFWLAGRYSSAVYALSTKDGHLIARIAVGLQPHGLCVWPQPGRFSLGHTGVTR